MTEILFLAAGVLIGLGATQCRRRRFERRGRLSPTDWDEVEKRLEARPISPKEAYDLLTESDEALTRLMKFRQVEKCENLRRLFIALFEARVILAKYINNLHKAVYPEQYDSEGKLKETYANSN